MTENIFLDRLAIRQNAAIRALGGSEKLFRRMLKNGWLRPIVKLHRLQLYAVQDLHACVERLKRGDIPSDN